MFVQPCEFLYDRYVNFVALALLPMMEGIDIPHDRKGGGLIRTSIKSWLRNLISSDISNRFFPRSFWALVVFTLLLTDLRPHCRILQCGWHLSSRSIDWSLFWMSPALHTCPTPRCGINHPVLTPYTSVFTHQTLALSGLPPSSAGFDTPESRSPFVQSEILSVRQFVR